MKKAVFIIPFVFLCTFVFGQNFTASITNTRCDQNTGVIIVDNVLFGSGPYTYSIDGGAFSTSNTFSDLSKGVHEVTVTDNSGLNHKQNFEIENLSTPVVHLVTEDMMCSEQLGVIEIDFILDANPTICFLFG